MPKTARKKLKKKEEQLPKAPYEMPAPNDSLDAYGWDLSKLRYPSEHSLDPKDPDPGKHIFTAPQETKQTMDMYGHDAKFICPRYVQILLDMAPGVRKAAMAAHNSRYTKASIAAIQVEIEKVFNDVIIKDIEKNFKKIAPLVAQFYAARVAHMKKFGDSPYA
jgi:hypothetical protein